MNFSPWIKQLNRTRPVEPISGNLETDIVIVGGGIAGVSTAYFLLTQTTKRVVLLEADKIAHGATGHNAGQVSSDFEVPFSELVERFGLPQAAKAQRAIDIDARVLLRDIIATTRSTISLSEKMGYFGIQTWKELQIDLEDVYLKASAGLTPLPLYVQKEWAETIRIPQKYDGLYELITKEKIGELLETKEEKYVAVSTFLSGVMNSALFTEQTFLFLKEQFPDRFVASEGTKVSTVAIEKNGVSIYYNEHFVKAESVVLCTNGFESFKIINDQEKEIDTSFHEEVYGIVGYMAAYVDGDKKEPTIIAYESDVRVEDNPYYYVTRRRIDIDSTLDASLISIGGPQVFLPNRATYQKDAPYPLSIVDDIDTFTARTYQRRPQEMDFHWHGVMGYTRSKVRLIGPDLHDNRLLYNLGCNGIGILTSIYGGERIAKYVSGEVLDKSIFDVQL